MSTYILQHLFKKSASNVLKITSGLFDDVEKDCSNAKKRLGFLPISILEPDIKISRLLKRVIGDVGSARVISKKSGIYRKGGRYGGLGATVSDYDSQASIFNPYLAWALLSAYCPVGAKIYDPFAGGGCRAIISSFMGHKYFGIELRKEEVIRLKKCRKELDLHFDVKSGDALSFLPKRNSFDFSFTCPPYFDLEIYSDLKNDLSNAPTYSSFLKGLSKCMEHVFLSLKKDCFSIWIVGNFRDSKTKDLIHFSGDTIQLGLKAGFKLHDELIFKGASSIASKRSGSFFANRRSVRIHEHIIVFRK